MKAKSRKHDILLSAVLAACLLVFLLAGGAYFTEYLGRQIYVERTAQLNEITAQVKENLDNALDSHWNYLTAAINLLKERQYGDTEDVIREINDLEQVLEMESYSSMLMLLDRGGNCYDNAGKHGVWSDIDSIEDGQKRHTFISDSYIYQGNYWAFVQELEEPLRLENSQTEFTHVALLKNVQSLAGYYDSDAYGSMNETYVMKSNGSRMHDDSSSGNTIQAYNVLKALEDMEGQGIPDIRTALESHDTISANFRCSGTEYYYCIASLPDYDTLIMFMIPAEYVASGTVGMMRAVVKMLLILGVALMALVLLAMAAITRQQNSARLFRKEQESLRQQEELNARLEETNAMLMRSKETAEQAFQIAEEANRAKSAFLSNMSHDIRTPMNAIVGFAALMARDAGNPDKVKEYTRKITSSSQHLLGLINDILDISKIEAGKTTLNLSDENIMELVENIDSIIRPQMKAKGHTFELYSKEIKHEHIVMDKLRMNQILLNLLSNAVKYTPEGGHVTLTVQELPQNQNTRQLAHYRFIVADNGYGMSEEYQKKLFQAFTREEDSVTNKIQGTGLGMAITKNLLELMGGDISVESEKGKGTTFTVDLDLHINEQIIDKGFWEKNKIRRMLVADDEEVLCQSVQMAMEETGVGVEYVLDGQQAAALAKKAWQEGNPYDLVLLDWKMPGLDGVEAARRIRREITHSAPILILTSCDWPEIEEEGREAGIDAFLPKPFFLTGFRHKVDSVLHGEQEQEKANAGQESVLQGMHILVAEDNEINAEILSELLKMAGASCDICENGKAAVETFEKSNPGQYQVVLMDVQMPVMNGYDATKAIRELGHPLALKIPVIAMTANAFAEDIRDALEAGMNAHVSKPVDMAVLEQTVKAVMEAQEES